MRTMRTIAIWAMLICGVAIVQVDAKPFIFKVFAPIGGNVQSTATVSPANTQLFTNILTQKINLLGNFLTAKNSGGIFGFQKSFTFSGSATTTTTTTTTERPYTSSYTTEVNTDYIPEVSSSTQSVSTTTTELDIETPKPTVHPERPITTSTPIMPTKSTTEAEEFEYASKSTTEADDLEIITKSTTEAKELETTTSAIHGYSYRTPTSFY